MVIVMAADATQKEIEHVVERLHELGFKTHLSTGIERTIIGAIGDEKPLRDEPLEAFPGVEKVVPIMRPFKLASRIFKEQDTIVDVNGIKIGGNRIVLMAGPCAVESYEQVMETARAVKEAGALILRGGAFKPRTSPHKFQGLGEEGLKILAQAKEETGLSIVTEVMSPQHVEMVAKYTDIFQIGTRNMQNYMLLQEVGRTDKPVLLKRGMSARVEEWILSAEYILDMGNFNVILCERGIRTFETYTRNTLDLNAIPLVKQLSHLPVIVDPSHGTGRRSLVIPMARAAIAAGADGLLVEVHPNPEKAISDGPQSLIPEEFGRLVEEVKRVAEALGRQV